MPILSRRLNFHDSFQQKPPTYNFSDVRVNYRLWYSDNDAFTGLNTAKKIIKELNLGKENYRLLQNYTHSDFVWAWNARCHIYDDIVKNFDGIERQRGEKRVAYRDRVEKHVEGLDFANGCLTNPGFRTTNEMLADALDPFNIAEKVSSLGKSLQTWHLR